MKRFAYLSLILIVPALLPALVRADTRAEMERGIEQLEAMQERAQRNTLPLLTLMKQIGAVEGGEGSKRVKVIAAAATVRESDQVESRALLVARRNDEFPVLEQRDQWYRIQLPDGREGWIGENFIQPFTETAPAPGDAPPQNAAEIMFLAENLMDQVTAIADSAGRIAAQIEAGYKTASGARQNELYPLLGRSRQLMNKINEHAVYARYFYGKNAGMGLPAPAQRGGLLSDVTGRLSMQLGKSSYEAGDEESMTARDLQFNANKRLSENAQLNAALSHKSEVIQTPYGTTDLRLGYDYRASSGLTINSFGLFQGYDDKAINRNSFNRFGTGLNLRYPMNPGTVFFSDLAYEGKNYDEEGGNSYSGGRFNAGFRFNPRSGTQWLTSVRGIVQSSDISYLNFHRFLPQVSYMKRSGAGSFNARLELEQFGYAEEAENNNFLRERIDLTWSRKGSQRQFALIGKQFPNNEAFGYLKMLSRLAWQSPGFTRYSRTEFSLLLVHFPQGGEEQVDYLDLRADRSNSNDRRSLDFSLFGRFWSTTSGPLKRDHVVDLYARYGFKLKNFTVGPLLGAHLLLAKNEKAIRRDGNSLRAGADFRGNFAIKKSSLNLSVRYERDFVFGNKITIDTQTGETSYGELVTRYPNTLQFSAGLRTPIGRDLEFWLDLSSYNINMDVDEEISINPVSSRSRFMLLAGLGYRFGS